jgi:MYXO-CTERM domain-containing protein
MKTAGLVVAVLVTLVGVIWIGQGTGYFPYPRSSFMIDQTPWAYRGAALAVVGVAAIVLLRRRSGARSPP